MFRNVIRAVSQSTAVIQSVRKLSNTTVLQAVRPLGPKCKLPEFESTAVVDGDFKVVSSNDYKGKWLIIFFYPLDFTFVCPTEIIAFGDRANEFRQLGCEVVTCSCDSHFSHLAWVQTPRKEGGLGDMNIPILSDFNKKIARNFGVLDEESGVSFRGLFLIDPNGDIRHTTCNDLPVGRSVDEALRVLKAFQFVEKHGEVCPADWHDDSPTIKPGVKDSKEYFNKVNKMSDELFAIYGTEFEDLEEEEKGSISRKPAGIQDQIVTDENGRRRFHGAFTGGFSAGYYNTVGSKEGWAPQEFRSSREQRAAKFQQRAEDLMDEEDLGEFGIGARRIRTAEDFESGRSAEKRMAWERDASSSSGTSMAMQLENIIKPVSDSIGKRMLRAMGWREGRGVGLTTAKSRRKFDDLDTEHMKAAAPSGFDPAAEDVLMTRLRSVEGVHGLGYEGLSASSALDERYGRVASAFKTNSKSKGIRGQAFGVGAFEDDDENIYSNYDLNQFDFALDAPGSSEEGDRRLDSTFVVYNKRLNPRKFYPPPKLPPNFRPIHRPKAMETKKLPAVLQEAVKTLTAIQRAKLLGEDRVSVMELVSDKDRKRLERHRSRWGERERSDVSGGDAKSKDRIEFPEEPMKQSRFKEFLKYLRRGLVLPQPKELSVWEWESEKKEFEGRLTSEERAMLPEVRARTQPLAKSSLALPIQELLQNKFTKETGRSGSSSKHDSDKMAAVKMGMFGERTRTTFQWYPHNSLAKRFNIPNPYPGAEIVGVPHMQKTSKKETLLNLGLPQTANELAHRAERHVEHVEEKEHDPDVAKVTKEEDLDRPPKSIFDAIFGESDNESDSDDEEEEEQEEREAHQDAGKERPKTEQQEANLPGSSKEREQNADEVKPKPITVMDIVDDEEDFGPAPPPSTGETIPGFSVLSFLKDEIEKRRKSKKHKSHKKHKSKKSKKEKHSKKSKEQKKSRRSQDKRHSSTSSCDSSVIEVID